MMKTLLYRTIFGLLCVSCALPALASGDIKDPFYLALDPESAFRVYESIEDALEYPTRVRALKLSGADLTSFPTEISKLSNLECVHFTETSVELTEGDIEVISSLKHLKCLLINKGKVSKIAPNFPAAAPNLEVLVLRNNSIRSVPNELAQLKRIMFIDFSGNPISRFPESVTKMDSLVTFWAAKTKIKSIDIDLRSCRNLRGFILSHGTLSSARLILPSTITGISLKRNDLRSLDGNFELWSNLEILNLEENPHFKISEKLMPLVETGVVSR